MAILDNLHNAFQPGGLFGNDEFDQKLMNYLLARSRPNSQQQQLQEIQPGNLLNEFPIISKEFYSTPSFDFNSIINESGLNGFSQTPINISSKYESQGPVRPLSSNQVLNIDMMRQAAEKVYPDNPTMQRVALAQAMLESGINFNSGLARQNNFFGIKAKGGNGTQMSTIEYENGVPVRQSARFATNKAPHQSFEQHKRLIFDAPRYDPVEASKTPEEAFINLQRAGYATDPRYAAKLNNIYKKYVAPLYK